MFPVSICLNEKDKPVGFSDLLLGFSGLLFFQKNK
jgi:hypothetical protein